MLTQGEHFIGILRELGVEVVSPFVVVLDGQPVRFDAYLPHYGSEKGVVFMLDMKQRLAQQSKAANFYGYFQSFLNADAETSLTHVKDTLDDWGYFGPEHLRPSWYTGKPWS